MTDEIRLWKENEELRKERDELRDALYQIAPTIQWAMEYAKHKDMMNSAWHRSPVKHRELTLDLISAYDILVASIEGVGK